MAEKEPLTLADLGRPISFTSFFLRGVGPQEAEWHWHHRVPKSLMMPRVYGLACWASLDLAHRRAEQAAELVLRAMHLFGRWKWRLGRVEHEFVCPQQEPVKCLEFEGLTYHGLDFQLHQALIENGLSPLLPLFDPAPLAPDNSLNARAPSWPDALVGLDDIQPHVPEICRLLSSERGRRLFGESIKLTERRQIEIAQAFNRRLLTNPRYELPEDKEPFDNPGDAKLLESIGDSVSGIDCLRLTEKEHDVLMILNAANRRMTTEEILRELSQRYGGASGGSTKQTLAGLVRRGLLDNRQDETPKGYGLREWTGGR